MHEKAGNPRWQTVRATVFAALGMAISFATAGALAAAEPIDFAHDIVPILRKHCGKCHTGDKKKGGLSLNARASLLPGAKAARRRSPARAARAS